MTDRDTINRVLAERVMGWTMGNISTKVEPDKNLDVWRDSSWSHIVFANVWDPMDIIAQAMMVADKLHEIGKMSNPAIYHQLMLRYDVFRNYEGALMWTASFGTGGRGDANTPAEAISRAAYEVVKGEQ